MSFNVCRDSVFLELIRPEKLNKGTAGDNKCTRIMNVLFIFLFFCLFPVLKVSLFFCFFFYTQKQANKNIFKNNF